MRLRPRSSLGDREFARLRGCEVPRMALLLGVSELVAPKLPPRCFAASSSHASDNVERRVPLGLVHQEQKQGLRR